MAGHYKTLGVSASATAEEIKSAYKSLAKKYHPDRNKDNKEVADKFKSIAKAYKTLSDESARKSYDLSLKKAPGVANVDFDSNDRLVGRHGNRGNADRVQGEVVSLDLRDAFKVFEEVFGNDPAHGGPFFTSDAKDVDRVFDAFFNAPPPDPNKFLKMRANGDLKSIRN